ncbi:hypothetical protein HHI36_006782 [Cryptolaemus montrouzieri]|uniref:Maturase K n=1 Tax=Cryptolaemus montrouzieri TaxID=559131 RepID=A0ABD2NYL0_9CUCU
MYIHFHQVTTSSIKFSLFFRPLIKQDIVRYIKLLENKKPVGCDEVPALLLKRVAEIVDVSSSHIIHPYESMDSPRSQRRFWKHMKQLKAHFTFLQYWKNFWKSNIRSNGKVSRHSRHNHKESAWFSER